MKQLFLLFFCLLPLVALSQNVRDLTEEEIRKDKDYIALQSQIKPVEEKINAIQKEYEQAPAVKKNDPVFQKAIEKRYNDAVSEVKSLLQTFVTRHPNSFISLLVLNELINSNTGVDISALAGLYKNLSEPVKKTNLGGHLGNQIQKASRTAIGAVALDFTQNDPNGKPIKLSDFRGKYVLIDFWASWCGPCRQENPNIVKAYAQFKNKNFEILGVSLDNPNAKTAWLNAIEKDKLTWPQVSDLQGWKNQVALLYGVESIPQNYLIDPKGVIIAKNLRGEELIRSLSNLLK
jgi:peroxiredoxin